VSFDWSGWEPSIRATLLFVIRDGRILLIRKLRGLGAGRINGPGGKLDPGETPIECAVRETHEELGIVATGVEELGELSFQWVDDTVPPLCCSVFRASGYDGEPTATDEAIPLWFDLGKIPFAEMWPDDELWFPHLLAGERFHGWYLFDGDALIQARSVVV